MKLSERIANAAGPASYWVDEVIQLEGDFAIAVTEYHECNRKRIELKAENAKLVYEIDKRELEISHHKAENEGLKENVVAMASEIEAMCPPRRIVKRWILDARRDALKEKP